MLTARTDHTAFSHIAQTATRLNGLYEYKIVRLTSTGFPAIVFEKHMQSNRKRQHCMHKSVILLLT